MSKYKKLLWICITIIGTMVALSTTWLAIILIGAWGKLNVQLRDNTFQKAFVGSEREFLIHLQDGLADCPNYDIVTHNITERLRALQSAQNCNPTENKGILALASAREKWVCNHLQGQIECLGRILIAIRNCDNHQEIIDRISGTIASARTLLSHEIIVAHLNDKVQRLTKSSSQLLYYPPEANQPLSVQWKEGGEALFYQIGETFPPNDFLDKLKEHYSSLGCKAFRYDLSEPLQLAGIEGGWRGGKASKFWSQAWRDTNGNVVVAEIAYIQKGMTTVVIMYAPATTTQAALEYYKRFHGDKDADPNDEVIRAVIREGYRFIPIRQR
jgi:hypothetical protein